MGDALLEVDLGSGFDVAHITAGAYHNCALSTSGGVKCFGGNWAGQLGYGDENNRGDDKNEMGDALLEVDLGSGALLEVDLGSGFDVAHITAGAYHNCALSTSGGVKCFGRNDFGQLGLGDSNNRGNEANEMGDALLEVD
eukprot:145867_1